MSRCAAEAMDRRSRRIYNLRAHHDKCEASMNKTKVTSKMETSKGIDGSSEVTSTDAEHYVEHNIDVDSANQPPASNLSNSDTEDYPLSTDRSNSDSEYQPPANDSNSDTEDQPPANDSSSEDISDPTPSIQQTNRKGQESYSKTGGLKRKSAAVEQSLLIDGDGKEMLSTQSTRLIEKRTVTAATEDSEDFADDSDTDDEEVQLPTLSRKSMKRKYTILRNVNQGGDGEQLDLSPERELMEGPSSTKPCNKESDKKEDDAESYVTQSPCPIKRSKMRTKQGVAADSGPVETKGKIPWTQQEKMAVQQFMTSFVAMRKVPGKNECIMCIEKSSPALQRRTWKDVKYFVHNEILKIKKTLKH
ncbi:uncharacterized protein ACNS7B_003023 isoform 3-T3 [Menidia menidia]